MAEKCGKGLTMSGIQYIDTGVVVTAPDGRWTAEVSEETKRLLDLTAFLRQHKAAVDEHNRLTLQCLCDGTYLFLYEMVHVLAALGCADIHTRGESVTHGVPEDKPWCNYLFKASGVLPENML